MDKGRQEEQLLARRQELLAALGRIESELDQPATADLEDWATEREGDEVLEALGHAESAELRALDAALDRLARGTYGTCLTCGEPISAARLAAVPTAALCRTCAAGA
ncbi:dimethylmenaquinone methyltransferase [Roseivivax halodurans JCM 10272]|uniref:Dimethylmenaquinone methyltransferase n=1 Tax=Roseivivax halodurans JCM 10272 TaxID=1449350 RepID=X7EEY2_9RHOB|nr:dimethylmenaquinone methyltransferase [Roseivivax halodurans JCM 10272]